MRAAYALVLLVALSATARAQDEPADEAVVYGGAAAGPVLSRRPELRLTGADLASRGVANLAEALDLIPELYMREMGRGGQMVTIRGARRGAVKVLLDGVPVDDIYYGTFDVTQIPVTDIVEIRVSTRPASPLDGHGGSGGVIDVRTLDAKGGRMLRARVVGSTLPSVEAAASGREPFSGGFAARASATGLAADRAYEVEGEEFGEDRQQAGGLFRLEYEHSPMLRTRLDGAAMARTYAVPPVEEGPASFLFVDHEVTSRVGVGADWIGEVWSVDAHVHAQTLDRRARYYAEPTADTLVNDEDIRASRFGLALRAARTLGDSFEVAAAAHGETEGSDVTNNDMPNEGRTTIGELAAGAVYTRGGLDVDTSVGLAVPVDADPWVEARIVATQDVGACWQAAAAVARKGRMPSVRDRFRTDIGNDELGPELVQFAEGSVGTKPGLPVEWRLIGWVRDTDGMIAFNPDINALDNVDDLVLYGADTFASWQIERRLSVGASYSWIRDDGSANGGDGLYFLPEHRADGWVRAKLPRTIVTGRLRWVDDQIDQGGPLPSYTTFDLSAQVRLTTTLSALVRVDDTFDSRYYVRTGVRSPGRTVALTLDYQFDCPDP